MSRKELDRGSVTKALALLEDAKFKCEYLNGNSTPTDEDKMKFKLLQAREENLDFEEELAELIVGGDSNFPNRGEDDIHKFFNDLGFEEDIYSNDPSVIGRMIQHFSVHDIYQVIHEGLFKVKNFKKKHFRTEETLDSDYFDLIGFAKKEFQEFIQESINSDETVNLSWVFQISLNDELYNKALTYSNDPILNRLIDESKYRFFIKEEKQVAVEKIWDAFERLKTYLTDDKKEGADKLIGKLSKSLNREYFENEFKDLKEIGNNYHIRHYETDKIEITSDKELEYLYFRMLNLIDLSLKSVNPEYTE